MKKFLFPKAVSVALAVSMVTVLASGCSSKSSSTSGSTDNAKAKTISLMASQDWIRDAEKKIAQDFKTKTGITVDYQIIPSGQYNNVLKTKLNSGECTDIFMTQSGKFDITSSYNITKNAVDLSKESWVSRENADVRDQASANGKLYGLTIWDSAPIYPIIYNKALFKQYGLSIPKTYADFKADCAKLLSAGITPIYEPGSDGWHMTLWFCEIGPIYEKHTSGLIDNLNANKAKFSGNETMKTALTELSEMVKLGYYGKNFLSQTFTDTEKSMASGKFAMTLDGLNTPKAIAKVAGSKYKDTDFGFFEKPLCDNNIMCYGTAAPTKFIYSGSSNIASAKIYFDFLTQQSNLQYYLDNDNTKVSLCFSGVKDTMSPAAKEYVNSYKEKGVYMQNKVKYLNTQWSDIEKDLQGLYTGAMTQDQVLKNIDDRRTQQAQEAKDPDWK